MSPIVHSGAPRVTTRTGSETVALRGRGSSVAGADVRYQVVRVSPSWQTSSVLACDIFSMFVRGGVLWIEFKSRVLGRLGTRVRGLGATLLIRRTGNFVALV